MEDFQEGELLLGQYQILSKLGEGRFGKVYKVKVLKGRNKGRTLAMKVAKDLEFIPYLWKEVQTLILFNHPHIVAMISYLYKKEKRELYVLYEYMDTGNLREYVSKKGKLEEKEAIKILSHVARGLEFLHSRGYIHGDVKPENVFGKRVLNSILWKIGDFGLMRIRGESGVIDIKGTVGYIAPEVFRGEMHRSSDIFSLGCLFYYMLTGEELFSGEERLRKNKECIYSLEGDFSDKAARLMELMLQREHRNRFKTAKELLSYMVKERLI